MTIIFDRHSFFIFNLLNCRCIELLSFLEEVSGFDFMRDTFELVKHEFILVRLQSGKVTSRDYFLPQMDRLLKLLLRYLKLVWGWRLE